MNGISIVGVYSANVKETETESICKQVHNFRDYLIASQIQGYALLSTAFNYVNKHATVHQLVMSNFKSARWCSVLKTINNVKNSKLYCTNQMICICFEFFHL